MKNASELLLLLTLDLRAGGWQITGVACTRLVIEGVTIGMLEGVPKLEVVVLFAEMLLAFECVVIVVTVVVAVDIDVPVCC